MHLVLVNTKKKLICFFIFICIAVSRALREATYPFLALICLRDNRMTVVGRMEGKFRLIIIIVGCILAQARTCNWAILFAMLRTVVP